MTDNNENIDIKKQERLQKLIEAGKKTRFRKGENYHTRRKEKAIKSNSIISEELKKLLAVKSSKLPQILQPSKMTIAQRLAAKLIQLALQNDDIHALEMILAYTEGRPKQKVEANIESDSMKQIADALMKLI